MTYAKVILDRSFLFSKEAIEASYILGTISKKISSILESNNFVSNNPTLLAMWNNLSEYYLIVSLWIPHWIQHLHALNPFISNTFFLQVSQLALVVLSHDYGKIDFWDTSKETCLCFCLLDLFLYEFLFGPRWNFLQWRNIIIFFHDFPKI